MAAMQKGEEAVTLNFGGLLDAGPGAVVTLVAGDTQLVAHRAVLSARSPVFTAMFAHEMVEARSGEVAICDLEGPVLRELVCYMYTLQAPQLPDMALPLLAAADKYGVSGLKADCERRVAEQLTVENAAAAAVLAVRHGCPHLKRAAVAFIKAHTHQVMATQGWMDAMLDRPRDLMEVSKLLAEPSAGTGSTTDSKHQPHGEHGSTPNAAELLSSQPDGTATSSIENLSAEKKGQMLIKMAEQGAVKEVRKLLAAGADVGARDDYWRTALHWAADRGHAAAARFLLEAGAQVDATDYQLDTPLHLAAAAGHPIVVRLLLAFSANPNSRDHNGYCPLHWAARHERGDMVLELLHAGAKRSPRNGNGQTPLEVLKSWHGLYSHLITILEK